MSKTVKLTIEEICYYDVDIPLSELDVKTQELIEKTPFGIWVDLTDGIRDWLYKDDHWDDDPFDPERHVFKVREVTDG